MEQDTEIFEFFKLLIKTLMPQPDKFEFLSKTRTSLTLLFSEYADSRRDIGSDFQLIECKPFGGLERNIVTQDSDIDFMMVLHSESYNKIKPKIAIDALYEFVDELNDHLEWDGIDEFHIGGIFPNSNGISFQIETESVYYATTVDLIPALIFEGEGLYYENLIPKDNFNWTPVSPRRQIDDFNRYTDNHLPLAAYIFRYWVMQHDLDIPSFVADNCFVNLEVMRKMEESGSKESNLVEKFGDYFIHLQDFYLDTRRSGRKMGWSDTDEVIGDKEKIIDCLKSSAAKANRALQLEKKGSIDESLKVWEDLFMITLNELRLHLKHDQLW